VTIAAPESGADQVITFVLAWWWLIFLFGGAALETVTGHLRHALKVRHKRRVQLARARAAAPAPAGARAVPGPCQHLRVSQVRDRQDVLVAWLCLNEGCGQQLPADWAVAAEDLDPPR
jgi:hypothetical protein